MFKKWVITQRVTVSETAPLSVGGLGVLNLDERERETERKEKREIKRQVK